MSPVALSPVADDRGATTARSRANRPWTRSYIARLLVSDIVIVCGAVFGAQRLWPGASGSVSIDGIYGQSGLSYTVISLAVILIWLSVLALFGTRDERVIGAGSAEYKRVADATFRLFAVMAMIAYLFRADLARGYLLTSLPVGLCALLLARWGWRRWLAVQRSRGQYSHRVLLVGSLATVALIARDLARTPQAGYVVVGACLPGSAIAGHLPGTDIPVSTHLDDIPGALEATGADTVVVTSSDELSPGRIRELSWSLEPGRQHLVLAPSLTDVGGPRISMRPVAGLPLIHVETPHYEGRKLIAMRLFDLVLSAVMIILLSPVLLAIAICIRLSTPGPVLFRQERVGLNGAPFTMLKFRSMVIDAEQRLAELTEEERTAGNEVLFKMKNDPRVTPIGAFLRRFSLDELPQLVNVFLGSMSLVGPRPPLQREVMLYENHVHRRFLVKPGVTGLWQVSGRSNLSWDDAVRLDLYYVENWSIVGDLIILWRTARAVLAREGAF